MKKFGVLILSLIILGACASNQSRNLPTADLSTITEPVPVGIISLQMGITYFSTEEIALEGFTEFFSNHLDTILDQFTERTGVVLDIGDFRRSINSYENVTIDDVRVRSIDWVTEVPPDEVWARLSVIFTIRGVSTHVYILKPGRDLVYGVHTVPTAHIYLDGVDKRPPSR